MKASYELMNCAASHMLGKVICIMRAMTPTEMDETDFTTLYDHHLSPLVLEVFRSIFDVADFDSEDMETLHAENRRRAKEEWTFRTGVLRRWNRQYAETEWNFRSEIQGW